MEFKSKRFTYEDLNSERMHDQLVQAITNAIAPLSLFLCRTTFFVFAVFLCGLVALLAQLRESVVNFVLAGQKLAPDVRGERNAFFARLEFLGGFVLVVLADVHEGTPLNLRTATRFLASRSNTESSGAFLFMRME